MREGRLVFDDQDAAHDASGWPRRAAGTGGGQDDDESAAAARLAVHDRAAAVPVDDVTDHGEADAGALHVEGAGRGAAQELAEDAPVLRLRDARPGVGDRHADEAIRHRHRDLDGRRRRRVLDRVVEEVADGARQRLAVAGDQALVGRQFEVDDAPIVSHAIARRFDDLAHELRHRDGFHAIHVAARFHAREVEEVLHHLAQPAVLAGERPVVDGTPLVGNAAFFERLGQVRHGGQRRAELVRDGGDEVRLQPRNRHLAIDRAEAGVASAGQHQQHEREAEAGAGGGATRQPPVRPRDRRSRAARSTAGRSRPASS